MKNNVFLTVVFCLLANLAVGQSLFVPSGVSGISSSSNGNVGIGVGSPLSKLDVNGDIQISNASIPMGLITEVGGTTPLLNLSLNFREPSKNNTFRGLGFRLDSRGGQFPAFQWLARNAGQSVENVIMSLTDDGKLGIGITNPSYKLTLAGGDIKAYNYDNNSGISIGSENTERPRIGFHVSDNSRRFKIELNNVNQTTERLGFFTINGGAWSETEVFSIGKTGKIGIGTSDPDAKLTVNGTIHSKEVKVDLDIQGPDYVFEKDYPLPSLEQIKSYIDQNKHLPEVPSAKEMEANGVNLGEMNMLLLRKIEELTLYAIEQNKKIEMLERRPDVSGTPIGEFTSLLIQLKADHDKEIKSLKIEIEELKRNRK